MSIRFSLLLCLVYFLQGCQKGSQGVDTQVLQMPPPVNNQNAGQSNGNENTQNIGPSFEGPNDSGGGDTCNGKLIESYKVQIENQPEFKEFILPIYTQIFKNNQGVFSFAYGTTTKTWYIIDCELDKISKERKGLFLESYQSAIHTEREIFIDGIAYVKMALEEKAKLILHELVMSAYLLKYLSFEEICKRAGSCQGDYSSIARSKLYRQQPYKPLDSDDHQKIRKVVAWIWDNKEKIDIVLFKKILKDNDFDQRFDAFFSSDENQEKSEAKKNEKIEISVSDLYRVLKRYQYSGGWPTYCQFDSKTLVSKSKCVTTSQVEYSTFMKTASNEIKMLNLDLNIVRESDGKVFHNTYNILLNDGDQTKMTLYSSFLYGHKVAPIAMLSDWPNFPGVNAKEGMRSNFLYLYLDITDLKKMTILQVIPQKYVWYSFEDIIKEKEGLKTKEVWGHKSLLGDESEDLFFEDELPFVLDSTINEGVFIKAETL